jgi:hypothetical protein
VVARYHDDENPLGYDAAKRDERVADTLTCVAGDDDGFDAIADGDRLDRGDIEMKVGEYLDFHDALSSPLRSW